MGTQYSLDPNGRCPRQFVERTNGVSASVNAGKMEDFPRYRIKREKGRQRFQKCTIKHYRRKWIEGH